MIPLARCTRCHGLDHRPSRQWRVRLTSGCRKIELDDRIIGHTTKGLSAHEWGARLAISRFDPAFLAEADCPLDYLYTWAYRGCKVHRKFAARASKLIHRQLVSLAAPFTALSALLIAPSRSPSFTPRLQLYLPRLRSCCVAGASVGAIRPSHDHHAHLPLPCVHPDFYRGEHRFVNRRWSEVD